MANTFAFAESRGGALRRVAFETVSAARALADACGGGEVHAFLAGAPGVSSLASELGKYGADVVIVVEHPGLANANAESLAATAAERIRAGGYRAAVFSASAQGRDLAPRVAAKLGVGMAADVIAFELSGDALVVKHPAYAGKVIATLKLTGSPAIMTLHPGARAAVEAPTEARVESAQPAADPGASKVLVKEMIAGGGAKLDIGDAPVIVSGGRGLKSADNFRLVEDLAAAFGNAAVGATRAVTDDGWRPHSDQIGQTGRQVSPDLYVACGISGAIQHIAGMRNSRTIVAINKDKEAPIFKVADYGIVGDVVEILPVLTAAVKEAREKG
ncbi:MAG: electron transfer flavoprotein subunit alpha/FixB family protein [Gemmatimonadota bacterium]